MKQFMGRIGATQASARMIVSALACCLVLTGCALWRTDRETVGICGRGFTNDPEWDRASRLGRAPRALWKQFPGIEFEGRTNQPSKTTTAWFRNATSSEFASCSKHSCDTGRCLWRVRLYSREQDRWRVRMEYDLGHPVVKSQ